MFPFFLKDNTVTFSFSNGLFSGGTNFVFSLMISEIAGQMVKISPTLKIFDMSDKSAFALDCWYLSI